MKTIDIIQQVAKLANNFLYHSSFESWLEYNDQKISKLPEIVPEDMRKFFPLRNEVWKLIYKELYNQMPYSKEYILTNYRSYKNNIPYVVYPSKIDNPRLIVSFSGYIDYESYARLSWFWDKEEKWNNKYVFLFLNCLDKHWYVGTPLKPKKNIYLSIIKDVQAEFSIDMKDTYLVGSSMGGYASLLFGITLNVGGIISVHPQLTKKSAHRYELDNWKRQISECGHEFIDIDDLIAQQTSLPNIYLEISQHPSDLFGVDNLVAETIKRKSLLILRQSDKHDHQTKEPSMNKIKYLINFFANYEK